MQSHSTIAGQLGTSGINEKLTDIKCYSLYLILKSVYVFSKIEMSIM